MNEQNKPVIGDAEVLAFNIRGDLGEFNDHNKSIRQLVREVVEIAAHARYAGSGEVLEIAINKFAQFAKNKLGQQAYMDDLASAFLEQVRRGIVTGISPPAQPKVPDEINLIGFATSQQIDYADGWNACREAMLSAQENNNEILG